MRLGGIRTAWLVFGIVGVWVLVGSVGALGAYGPVKALRYSHKQREPVWRARHDQRVEFVLPSSWQRAHGSQEGTISVGSYARYFDLGQGATCMLEITSSAAAAVDPPRFAQGLLRSSAIGQRDAERLVVRAHGRHANVRWYIGDPTALTVVGVAVARVPAGFAPPRDHAVADIMLLTRDLERLSLQPDANGFTPLNPTRAQRHSCARLQRRAVEVLRAALQSIAPQPGSPFAKSPNG